MAFLLEFLSHRISAQVARLIGRMHIRIAKVQAAGSASNGYGQYWRHLRSVLLQSLPILEIAAASSSIVQGL